MFLAFIFTGLSLPATDRSTEFKIAAAEGQQIAGKTLSTILTAPAINNAGTIVFQAGFAGGTGIFTPTQLLIATGDSIGGKQLVFIGDGQAGPIRPAINDNGTVAFTAVYTPLGGPAIFTVGPGQFLPVPGAGGSNPGPDSLSVITNIAINNAGSIVFKGFFLGGSKIYSLQAAQTLATMAKQAPGPRSFLVLQVGPPAENDAGTVVFKGLSFSPPATVLVATGASIGPFLVAPGDRIGGKTITALGLDTPAINNRGTVVFTADYSAGTGIFSLTHQLLATGDRVAGTAITKFGDIAIDDKGKLVFLAAFDGGSGIFTKSKLLIATNDVINGKTLTGMSGLAMNNAGEIAFLGVFADGTRAIVTRAGADEPGDEVQF